MYDWTSFETVFEPASRWAYEPNLAHTISRNRQNNEGVLFFDRIWKSLGLKQHPVKVYPPKSNQDLRTLFDTILSASAPDHQKHSLVYYILKDCKLITDHGEAFCQRVDLPRKYKVLTSGLHNLDHGQTKQALELLTDPSLPPTFSDQILYTLLQNSKLDRSLVMAYSLTVSPPLEDHKTLNAYFSFLSDTSITYAYSFCQRHAGSQRRALFEKLIQVALSSEGNQTASRAETLIALPFTNEEVLWFEAFLLHGKGSTCHGAKDSVVMRRIATGRDYAEIPALQQFRGQKIDGADWGSVRTNLRPHEDM